MRHELESAGYEKRIEQVDRAAGSGPRPVQVVYAVMKCTCGTVESERLGVDGETWERCGAQFDLHLLEARS